MTGKIIKLIRDKGIGFIKGEDNVEYFFHRSAVSKNAYDSLQEGGLMAFEPNPNAPKGARAESCVPQ